MNTMIQILKKKNYRFFRGYPFIDREEEIKFLNNWFTNIPNRVLFLYGPKSTGKTTLMEYVLENLDKNYWVNYLNLRRTLIASYENFVYSFFEEEDKTEELNRTYDLKIFKLEAKTLKAVKSQSKNLFAELIRQFEKIKEQKIFVIDEIQVLEDIYVEENKELLKEFLNFCVALTKELHLVHVVILTSNTIFLERIYNDARMKETSDFKLINHPDKSVAIQTLKDLGYSDEKIELIIEYYGSVINRIIRLYTYVKPDDSIEKLREFLEEEMIEAKSYIIDILVHKDKYNLEKEREEVFIEIITEMVEKGLYDYAHKRLNTKRKVIKIIEVFSEKEIFFFEPKTSIVTPNSRIYLKAMQSYLKDYNGTY